MPLFPLVNEEIGLEKAVLNFVPDGLSLLGRTETPYPDIATAAFFTFSIKTVL